MLLWVLLSSSYFLVVFVVFVFGEVVDVIFDAEGVDLSFCVLGEASLLGEGFLNVNLFDFFVVI